MRGLHDLIDIGNVKVKTGTGKHEIKYLMDEEYNNIRVLLSEYHKVKKVLKAYLELEKKSPKLTDEEEANISAYKSILKDLISEDDTHE